MRRRLQSLSRSVGRVVWLGAELGLAAIRYGWGVAAARESERACARAAWMQRSARRLVRVFGLRVRLGGQVPTRGLLVCNHLGYLDVLLLAALAPCVFVAKSEVAAWPLLGWFARRAGTVFVRRSQRLRVGEEALVMQQALAAGTLVVLFPEGTSTGGDTVLPFKSALLEPAAHNACVLSAGWIAYELDEGDPREDVCYWKDMTLAPHLFRLLGKRSVRARVRFAALPAPARERKLLARQLHAEVSRLRAAAA